MHKCHFHSQSRARAKASYLYGQALADEDIDRETLELAKGLLAGTVTHDEAIEQLAVLLTKQAQDDYQDRLTGLRTAVAAVGETGYLEAVDRLAALHLMDDDGFRTLTEGLRTAFLAANQHGYAKALDGIIDARLRVDNPVDAEDRAWNLLQEAQKRVQDPDFQQNHGIRLRQDIDPKLRALLQVRSDAVPDLQTVQRLLANRTTADDPIPGKWYKKADVRSEQIGFLDISWSAGKTSSIAHAFADQPEREAIRRAHRTSVEYALRQVEKTLGKVWFVENGERKFERGAIGWVVFDHFYSRLGDPLLHSHAAIFSTVQSIESDRVGSFRPFNLKAEHQHLREAYHKTMAFALQREGFDAYYDPEKIEARLQSVPDNIVKAFSRRNNMAEDRARKFLADQNRNFDELSPHERKQHLYRAAAATRRKADPILPAPEDWRRIAEAEGWKPADSYLTDTGKAIQQTQALTQRVKERTPEQRKHWRENRLWQKLTQALNQRHGGGRRGQYLEEEESSQRMRR